MHVYVPTLYDGVPLYTGDGLVLAEVEVGERLVLLYSRHNPSKHDQQAAEAS